MKNPIKGRRATFWLMLTVLLLLLIATLVRTPPSQWDKAQHYAQQLQSLGLTGVALFLLVATMATAVGLPRQLFGFVAGYAYGAAAGLAISTFAAICGCALTFVLSRHFLATRVANGFPVQVAWLDKLIRNDAFLKILVLRLQPLGTNLLTNLCAGVSAISARVFLLSSVIGYVPQMLVFNLMGSGVRIGSTGQLVVSGVLLGVSVLLGLVLLRRHKLSR